MFRSAVHPNKAIRQFPAPAGAYLAKSAFEGFLDSEGIKPDVFARAFEAGCYDVAARIDRGETPQARLKTPITFLVKGPDGAGRDR